MRHRLVFLPAWGEETKVFFSAHKKGDEAMSPRFFYPRREMKHRLDDARFPSPRAKKGDEATSPCFFCPRGEKKRCLDNAWFLLPITSPRLLPTRMRSRQ
ncbi:hypothetical protein MUK42_33744 [Musa troglodytarum]|uniref:Uncharacterized protein n=1 Tax=Musa troglodytarum TaxID=320322 RepID=A0A9E7GDI2_9LILI|nr:hypothetical protein MUK42_33744 [Musa troglodytarum]